MPSSCFAEKGPFFAHIVQPWHVWQALHSMKRCAIVQFMVAMQPPLLPPRAGSICCWPKVPSLSSWVWNQDIVRLPMTRKSTTNTDQQGQLSLHRLSSCKDKKNSIYYWWFPASTKGNCKNHNCQQPSPTCDPNHCKGPKKNSGQSSSTINFWSARKTQENCGEKTMHNFTARFPFFMAS